ncbi:MAG TPA: GHMP kinase [Dehalococcoidales bacterium]|nr:GHMP kinase [Dehalococcoidales bacterium]
MILSRAPLRISLGGGGTDLSSYYSKFGGFLIAAAINRYCTILANRRFYDNIRLSYSETEIIDNVDNIKHPIFRECLKVIGVNKNIELHSTGEMPANSGLGSSSAFTVALLNALHTYKGEFVSKKELAEEACHIEINLLGEPIGKQDQYMAAFGGLTCLTFEKNGNVHVAPLNVTHETLDTLETNLLFFFTGKERSASAILQEQDMKIKKSDFEIEQNLHQIKSIGLDTKKYLETGKVDILGEMLHRHWESKKKLSSKMTDPFIDECYEIARKNGAMGGKLIGAGGGGFFMFYCADGKKTALSNALIKMGLRRERFGIDWDGARIMLNTKNSLFKPGN